MRQDYYFEHIFYEMVMYEQTFRLLFIHNIDIIHNAIWESHIIHLRNLIDFFDKSSSSHEDDILVSKVLVNTDFYPMDTPQDFKDKLNKSVQHLSTYGSDELEKSQLSKEVVNIHSKIFERIIKFSQDVKEPENLIGDYKDDYQNYLLEEKRLKSLLSF